MTMPNFETEVLERNTESPADPEAVPSFSAASAEDSTVTPQACSTCGAAAEAQRAGNPAGSRATGPAVKAPSAPPAWVYALGRIEARFPKVSVEKEFAQAVGRAKTEGLTDRQVLHTVLSSPQNHYLIRQLCWVMTIEGLETYILSPRDSADYHLLVECLRTNPAPGDLDVLIGARGPLASPETCNGLQIPLVKFDQLYSFDRAALIKAIPRPKETAAKDFEASAESLFDRIMLMADNAGSTDEHRALNYLAVRSDAIYHRAAEQNARDYSLSAVTTRVSPLSHSRKMLNVIFAYTHRTTDVVEKFFTCVDVTDEFPFLVTKLTPTFDRP
jgi:hypothetical protein